MHDFHAFEVAVAVLGGLLVAGALLSGLAKRSFLSLTALFVVAGFVLGDGGLEVLEFEAESEFVQALAVVALILILFRDGLEVEAELLQEDWHLPLRKLVFAMPITAALIAVAAHALTDLDWTESFLLGALLSPTDPVLSSAVVTNPRVPRRIRHSLNLESGLNDGLALPAVLALLFSLDPSEDGLHVVGIRHPRPGGRAGGGRAGGICGGEADAGAPRARHRDQPPPEVAVRARCGVRGLWRGRAAP